MKALPSKVPVKAMKSYVKLFLRLGSITKVIAKVAKQSVKHWMNA